MNRLTTEEFKASEKNKIIVVLDNIRSAMNVGSIFRSADAFALEKILLSGITPHPPHKEISKTAIGATESVDWEYFQNINQELLRLKEEGYRIIAVEQTNDAIPLEKIGAKSEERIVLILGNEVNGVSEELIEISDQCVEVSQFGTKHSLNVSVCAGIVFWAFINNNLH